MSRYHGVFPNLNQAVASYSPVTMHISLERIKQKDFGNYLKTPTNSEHAEKLGIILHEIRHYVDHLSTLWGQNHLLLLYRALNARLGQDEFKFSAIITYKKNERELHFAEYYHEIYKIREYRSDNDRWGWELTTGQRFLDNGIPDESRPLLFVRFLTKERESLSRVPVSIASLLETTATYQEVEVRSNFVQSLSGTIQIKEQEKLTKWAFGQIVYNCKLTLYNVAVHLTANILDLTDVREAFRISSAIATLTLNLPPEHSVTLPLTNPALAAWGSRPSTMLKNQDYGFIFYTLLYNYRNRFAARREYCLAELLEANNLPTEFELTNILLTKFSNYRNDFNQDNLSGYFRSLHDTGRQLLVQRGIDGTKMKITAIITSGSYKPNIIFADTRLQSQFENLADVINSTPIDTLSHQDYFSLAELVDERMSDFYEIRGI